MKIKFFITLGYVVLSSLLASEELKAQPHCKLGWQVQPYFCDMDSLILTAYAFGGAEPYSYLWSTGETTVSIYAVNAIPTTYSVTVTGENGCTASGTFTTGINVDPYINGTPISCENFPIYLDAVFPFLVLPPPGVTYLWSTGATTHNITVLQAGTYSVTFTDPSNGCDFVTSQTVSFLPAPDPVITGPTQLCGGQDITLTATGGPFNEYLWLPGLQNTPSITINSPGTYIVQVVGSNFCYGYDTITVTSGANVTINGITTASSSCSAPNGAIDLTVNPSGSYTYLWSNNATAQDINNLSPGSYSVSVTAGGCTLTSSFTILDNTTLPNPILTPVAETCGLNNGAVNLSITPAGTYTYNWSNGSTAQNLSNVSNGTYTVTVTGSNGCSSSASVQVANNNFIPQITGTTSPNTSCSNSNGVVNISMTPAGAYSFSWSNGANTEDLNNIAAGIYTVTVTSGNTCTATMQFIVDNLASMPTFTNTIVPTSCGENNGTIALQVNNGQAPFTYIWSNGNTNDVIMNVPAGNYTVTVSGSNGCSAVATIDLPNIDPVINISGTITPNTSCNQSNGGIDITINPSSQYVYNWSSGAVTQDLSNIPAGTYTVTVTLGNTCAESADFIVLNSNIPFDITANVLPNTSCSTANGNIDVMINSAGSYTYLWSTGATTEDLQNLAGGNYTITVTNIDGCSISASFLVGDQSNSLSLSAVTTSNNSCLNPDGSIDLTVIPGGSYFYQWSSGQNTEDLQFLAGGNYAVTVMDNNSCTTTSSFIVANATSNPVVTSTVVPDLCMNNIGAIDLTTSPTGNTFAWSSGETSEDINQLPAGYYTVTVSALNGCVTSDTFEILNTSNFISLIGITTDNISCIIPTGTLDLQVLPIGTYLYSWSTGASTQDLSTLGSGLYSVTVTDLSNCSSSASFTIQNLTADPVITEVISPAFCGSSNGSIELTISPSNGNTVIWSNGNTNEDLLNVTGGIYSVTVTNSNGCSATASYTIPDTGSNFSINAKISDNQSCSAGNGSIIITILPMAAYTYSWSNGMNTSSLFDLTAGTYSLTVTDQNGCTSTKSFDVLNQTISPSLSTNITPATCGQENGSVDLNVSGSTNNTFNWSNGNTGEDLLNIGAGNYVVTVTSEFGCVATANIILPNINSNFTVTAVTADDSSCVQPGGFIDLTIQPIGNYSISWSNGTTNEDLQNLSSGIYEVTITDGAQCSVYQIFTIENLTSSPFISDIIHAESCGSGNGSILLNVTPSQSNTFLWSTGDITDYLDHLSSGQYSVTVTDPHGCKSNETFTVPETTPVEVSLNANLTTIQHDRHATCNLDLNIPLNAIESINWTPEGLMSCHETKCLTQEFTLTTRTEIRVTVIDTNGCSGQARLILDLEPEYKVYIPNVFSPNQDGPNDRFTVFANDEVEEVVLLEIYDRWGDLVFTKSAFPPNIPNYGWDGFYHDQLMNPDVFAYRAVVHFTNGEDHTYKGDVTLVR